MHRRDVLEMFGALALLGAIPRSAASQTALAQLQSIGKPMPFDYASLKGRARALAARAYQPPVNHIPPEVKQLGWDQYQSIQFRPDHALWADERRRFTARFFHLGLFFHVPVRMHEVVDGRAREIAYDPAMFDHRKSGLAGVDLPPDLGFAGFRIPG